ncbi:hypothetical protein SAMN05444050_1401 [Afipia sp. GAS231]|nr:hypothetical protein SAMN05444050_1401 [Afipia sp. GAS231]
MMANIRTPRAVAKFRLALEITPKRGVSATEKPM